MGYNFGQIMTSFRSRTHNYIMQSRIIFLTVSIFLFSCQQSIDDSDAKTETKASITTSYSPPFFEDDKRKEIIKKLSPQFDELIQKRAEGANIPGISFGIVVDDELVHTFSTGKMNIKEDLDARSTAAYKIASMTKSFTAMTIMKLRDLGKLSLSDPAEKYIPEMKSLNYLTRDASKITIENLLTMTAGFPEDNPWGDRQLEESEEMLMGLVSEGVSFSNVTGYSFEYSNTGYALLGNIISKVSGKPFGDYIREVIFDPLGMDNTYWEIDNIPSKDLVIGYRYEDQEWKLEPMLHHGAYGSMGGLITSIEDFSKYVSLQLSAWPPRNDEEGPVKRSSLREMQTPQHANLATNAKNFAGEDCALISGYGYGLGIRENCDGIKYVTHGGALPGYGSNYVMFPEYGIGLMAFCNLTYTSPWDFNEIAKLLFEEEDLGKRVLPVSDILVERKEQVLELIKDWNNELGNKILAENFYMDEDKAHRKEQVDEVIEKIGGIKEVENFVAFNQLRGRIDIEGNMGKAGLFFTLTPEKEARIQQLDVWVKE